MKKYIIIIALGIGIVSCNSYQEIVDIKGYKYEILKSGNSKNLLFLCEASNIVGIDTTTFTVEVQLRMNDMSFGGVTKLPNGGIAFTHERRTSNNAWGETLYVTDDEYSIVNTYPVCPSPMAPKVVNNVLMVGSSGLEEGGTMKFQLYNISDFSLIKEFLLEDMVDAWRILGHDNYAYFGVPVNRPFPNRQYSYLVELDLNTNNITEFFDENDFFKESAYSLWKQDSILYVFNIGKKDACTLNLNNKTISQPIKISQYPEIKAINALNCFHPKYIDGHLYVFFGEYGYGMDDPYICHWVKLNAKTFALEKINKLTIPFGLTGPAYQFHAGRFYVIQVEKNVLFIDVESGEIVETVVLDID
ncbi:hypothetical protein AGMMS49965_01530 [Bacteroidia bacterium]|nr:hypothetical protein AGMMS49965_01530 [Bacteroidia bacterium]